VFDDLYFFDLVVVYTSLFTILVDRKTQNKHKKANKMNNLTKHNHYTDKHIAYTCIYCVFIYLFLC